MHTGDAAYLLPYVRAARRHGGGFGSLLWASPATQAVRFEAMTRLYDFSGRRVLDAGCGRGDFLAHLLSRKIEPSHYVGLEAVEALVESARLNWDGEELERSRGIRTRRVRHDARCGLRHDARCTIVRGDFVIEPARLFVGADAVVFSGSLNTLEDEAFYETIRIALDAAGEAVIFNFLDSPHLAASDYLRWHDSAEVERFARGLAPRVSVLSNYLRGDRTVAMWRAG